MDYDVIVIGSGPGGYVCAIRAAQLGMKTAIIEKYDTLGGTCLNVGCIPSKALLDSSENYHVAKDRFGDHGIGIGDLKLDMEQMINRKASVVEENVKGIAFLMKKNKIDVHHGWGKFKDEHTVIVQKEEEKDEEITGEKIVIATGSKPNTPDVFNYDKEKVITSTEALEIRELPERMVIVGAGIIGLELGSVFARLGTEVEIVEYMERALPGMDKDCGKQLTKSMKKLGVKFHFSHSVSKVDVQKKGVKVKVDKRDSEDSFELKADYCLVAIGRHAYTEGLGLEEIGLETDDKGRVEVNEHLQTKIDHIYAIGDVVRGAMLAHKAEEEGVFVAETMDGQKPHIHYNLIPGVVYTWPEVAVVGKTEEELKEEDIPYKVGKFPYKALGRARASGDTEGMIKLIAHKETDELLGAHMIGARVADLIMEAVAVMEYRGSAEDISRMSHPHPTYSEGVKEAALSATDDRPIHM
jgi:dihydrolipoamide dehydrogenase